MSWVALTLLAAFMQAMRTAGQKRLAESIDVVIVSWVRFLFGLPFALVFFNWFVEDSSIVGRLPWHYWFYVLVIALSQLLATLMAVLLLGRQNFAIGSTLVKFEAVFTALLGLILFAETLSSTAWLAVVLGILGLLLSSLGKFQLSWTVLLTRLDSKSAILGLTGGALFAVASVFIRQANLLLDFLDAPISQAVVTLTLVLIVQTAVGGVYVMATRAAQTKAILDNFNGCLFIGLTSMLGSFGWFGAYALQNSAYVKTLGQVEFLFTLLLTWFYFNEKIENHEYMAMALIVISTLLIFWSK